MREILFRGKRVDNGEWVYGYFSKHNTGKCFIRICNKNCQCSYEVDPITVGQYTGLIANGKKVFEGDVVRTLNDELPLLPECYKGKVGAVVFEGCDYTIHFIDGFEEYLHMFEDDLEVIDNIHDNPELVEVNT